MEYLATIHQQIVIIAHSTGGLIAPLWLDHIKTHNKIAYALISGSAGGIPGRTVKIKLTGVAFKDVKALKEGLSGIEGVTGVYQRQFRKGELELDVVSDKTAEDLASILSDRGCEIDGVSGSLVEGRGAEVPAP